MYMRPQGLNNLFYVALRARKKVPSRHYIIPLQILPLSIRGVILRINRYGDKMHIPGVLSYFPLKIGKTR